MPWRHLAQRDALFDRTRPRTRLLIRHQRHRRGGARMMAGLAALLQDRSDVLTKGQRFCRAPAQRPRHGTARTIMDAIPRKLTLRVDIAGSFHGHLYLNIGPTAVIAEIPGHFPRTIVHHHLKSIIAWFAKPRLRKGFSFFELLLWLGKNTTSRPGPRYFTTPSSSRRFPVPNGTAVIGGGDRQGQRLRFPIVCCTGFTFTTGGQRGSNRILDVRPARPIVLAIDSPSRVERASPLFVFLRGTVSVHVNFWSPKSFGTVTLKISLWRLTAKWVGCPSRNGNRRDDDGVGEVSRLPQKQSVFRPRG